MFNKQQKIGLTVAVSLLVVGLYLYFNSTKHSDLIGAAPGVVVEDSVQLPSKSSKQSVQNQLSKVDSIIKRVSASQSKTPSFRVGAAVAERDLVKLITRTGRPRSYTKQANYLDISGAEELFDLAEIEIELPGRSELVTFTKAFGERKSLRRFTWVGQMSGASEGQVVLSYVNGALSLFAQVGSQQYDSQKLNSGEYIVREVDKSALGERSFNDIADPKDLVLKGQAEGDEPGSQKLVGAAATDDSASTMLVAYTASARTFAGGTQNDIEAYIGMVIGHTNLGFFNSSNVATVSIVHMVEISYSGTNLTQVLPDSAFGNIPNLHNLRDLYAADLVHTMIGYTPGGLIGLAYLQTPTLSTSVDMKPLAFSAAHIGWEAEYVVAHEIGHNFGLDHDAATGGGQGVTSAANGYRDIGAGFRTIMGYQCGYPDACPPVPYFSNPDVLYNGDPTGVAGSSDSAEAIDITDSVMAGIYTGNPSITITAEPADAVIEVGQNLTLTCAATSSLPLSYAWYKNGSDLLVPDTAPGFPNLNITNAQAADSGNYFCQISNDLGPSITRVAQVTVTTAPTILSQTESLTIGYQEDLNLTVSAASPTAIGYQWQKNNVDIPGETGNVYSISGVNFADAGDYKVIVSNIVGSVETTPATVTVRDLGVTSHPSSAPVLEFGSTTLTVTAASTQGITYQWFKDGAPIPGAIANSLNLTNVLPEDAVTYYVVLTAGANIIQSDPVDLEVLFGPRISVHPSPDTVRYGSIVNLSVQSTAYPAPSYQWYQDSSPIVSAVGPNLILSNFQSGDQGSYTVSIQNAHGSTNSNAAAVTIELEARPSSPAVNYGTSSYDIDRTGGVVEP